MGLLRQKFAENLKKHHKFLESFLGGLYHKANRLIATE